MPDYSDRLSGESLDNNASLTLKLMLLCLNIKRTIQIISTVFLLISGLVNEVQAQEFPLKTCHLISKEKQKISAALSLLITAPNLEAHEWICYEPMPPDLFGQQKPLLSEVLLDYKPIAASEMEELSSLHRKLLLARVPASSPELKKNLNIRAQYLIRLFTKELVAGAGPAVVSGDSANYLCDSKTLNYNSPAFSNWLKSNNLRRRKDERDIDFAWRTYTFMRKSFTYNYDRNQDRKISTLCSTTASDCGGLSFLYCGALRANGIPARPLVGRWIKKDGSDDNANEMGQVHVKSEFFAKNVGWIPVDMSFAVSNKNDDPLKYFGKFNGDFVTFHTDTDLLVDSIWFGKSEVPWMQSPLFWVTGGGKLDGSTDTVVWQTVSE